MLVTPKATIYGRAVVISNNGNRMATTFDMGKQSSHVDHVQFNEDQSDIVPYANDCKSENIPKDKSVYLG